MKYSTTLFVFLILNYQAMLAQDFHFSQFNENPSLVNPALTGATNVLRASLVYKDQWRSVTTPYTSYGISVDGKFKASNWETVDPKRSMTFKKSFNRVSGGLSVYNDKAGDSKMGTLQTNVSLAMFFPLTKLSSLSFGLQGSFVQRKFDNSSLIYPSQYSGSIYDPSLSSGERFSQQNFSYPELGAGVLWSYGQDKKTISANDQIKALIGFSTYHINQPKQNFTSSTNDKLYRKYVFHGNILLGIPNSVIAIAPSWLAQLQGSSKEITAGTMIKYFIKDDSKYTGIIKRSSIGIGAYYRFGDAIIANILIETGKYAIGFSYDINSSGLSKVSKAKGGFEITLKFVTPAAYLYQRRSKAMFN
jgi:type IX secretion system PorP/SprF family membrane protein